MFAHLRRFHFARLVVLLLGLAVAGAGCGKKGPLVPPGDDHPPPQAPLPPAR